MEFELWQLLLGCLGAIFVGLGKGGLPGTGNLTVAIYAIVFPARESVGILLVVLICADVVAVTIYRRHAQWKYMKRLFPWAIVGLGIGYLVLGRINDAQLRPMIGVILLVITGLHFFRKWLRKRKGEAAEDTLPHTIGFQAATGITGGFATMTANAAGPVAALYFISLGLPKMAFIGTGAWFFFIINLLKVPLQISLENINWMSLQTSLALAPFAMAGALIAPRIVKHIDQKLFESLIWFFIIVAGVKLIF